jgi:uncharacterized iron-regulated membrane protein
MLHIAFGSFCSILWSLQRDDRFWRDMHNKAGFTGAGIIFGRFILD